MTDVERVGLFGSGEDFHYAWQQWRGMPEFRQEDLEAFDTHEVSFATEADLDAFEVFVGQKVQRDRQRQADPTPSESRALAVVADADRMLAEAETIPQIKQVIDIAEIARAFARKARLGLDYQNRMAEVRLRAEAKAGRVLRRMAETGERYPQGNVPAGNVSPEKLEDLGISRKDSHNFQAVAAVPDDVRAAYVAEAWTPEWEVSRAGLLRYARRFDEYDENAPRRRDRVDAVWWLLAARYLHHLRDLDPVVVAIESGGFRLVARQIDRPGKTAEIVLDADETLAEAQALRDLGSYLVGLSDRIELVVKGEKAMLPWDVA